MSEILTEPVKTMIEKACEAASALLRSGSLEGIDHRIEIKEHRFEDVITLYLTYNGDIVFKRVWQMTDPDGDFNDARAILYGSLLTEMLATYSVVATKAREHLEKGL